MTPAHLIPLPFETPRVRLVEKMTAELVKAGTFHDERAAMRTLRDAGFAMGDVVMCIDDARQAAMQDIAAREMGEP